MQPDIFEEPMGLSTTSGSIDAQYATTFPNKFKEISL